MASFASGLRSAEKTPLVGCRLREVTPGINRLRYYGSDVSEFQMLLMAELRDDGLSRIFDRRSNRRGLSLMTTGTDRELRKQIVLYVCAGLSRCVAGDASEFQAKVGFVRERRA